MGKLFPLFITNFGVIKTLVGFIIPPPHDSCYHYQTQIVDAIKLHLNSKNLPMKQLYAGCCGKLTAVLSLTNHRHSSRCSASQFFIKRKKAFSLFGAILLILTGSLLFPVVAKAEWEDNDDYWRVVYNAQNGSIYFYVRVYNSNGSDSYIEDATLQYSINEKDYSDFFWMGYNHEADAGSPRGGIGSMNGADAFMTNEGWTSGGNTWKVIRLQIHDNTKTIKKIRINGKWQIINNSKDDGIWGNRDITIPQMSAVNIQPYEFVTQKINGENKAKVQLSYIKGQINEIDELSKIKLFNAQTQKEVSGFNEIASSDYMYADIADSDIGYYFQQSAYDGRITTRSSVITIPAFTLPKSAKSGYDPDSYTASFEWKIDPVKTANFVKDRFRVQVADNEEFTDARDVYVVYDPDKSTYKYSDSTNLAPNMYFRVAREHSGTNWQTWDFNVSNSANVPFTAIDKNAVTLSLPGKEGADIRWKFSTTTWLPGASFVITRINNITKLQTDIKLSLEDYKKQSYRDPQIALCNNYSYTLQVLPPVNSAFTPFPPVQTTNSVTPVEIGSISNLTASKGYFPDHTELKWTSTGNFDYYIVKRAIYPTSNYVQLNTVSGSAGGVLRTEDLRGTPGVFYTYMITGVVKCNNESMNSNTLSMIGFRSPTGNISGRVTYENGQAVENVAVRVQSTDNIQTGKSVYLNGNIGSFLKLDSLTTPFADTALTVEAWIKPTDRSPENQVIFSKTGQYELGFNLFGQLYFSCGNTSVAGSYSNPNKEFVHVTGIYRKDSLILLLNQDTLGKVPYSGGKPIATDKGIYIGRYKEENVFVGFGNFLGYIDEMRVWNISLSQLQFKRDYTRTLTGSEKGLAAYWRFDETITNQFYDLSHTGEEYNRNDGVMDPVEVKRSDIIPSPDNLSIKGNTDQQGNYLISGIPFTGNGTAYTIVPLLGTHSFDPVSVNRLVSPTSSEFVLDFKDKSSFDVTGFVKYRGGTIPVAGVQFKIDGQYAQKSNGAIIETDATGAFSISVPVGKHEVMAVKNNHVFVGKGKITTLAGDDWNYQAPKGPVILEDSTTIRFIGRVAGGAIQEAYPLGHSLSKNNLGKEESITIKWPSEVNYVFKEGTDETKIVSHRLPSDPAAPRQAHQSRIVYGKNRIVIYPDPLTGEFMADLIPEKLLISDVSATGYQNNILFNGKPELVDLTTKFAVQFSVYNYKDSIKNKDNSWTYTDYKDTVPYQASYKFIRRNDPVVRVVQLNNSGNDLPYFGSDTYDALSLTGSKQTVALVNPNQNDKKMYVFGYPVFLQNQAYRFAVRAFEQYPFYESVSTDGKPVVKKESSKEVIDIVPTRDGVVSISNKVKNGSTDADVLNLDEKGTSLYEFTGGDPDLAAGGIKTLAVSVKFGSQVIVWNWFTEQQLSVLLLGGKLTGTNFVTAGPEKLITILRDPPGSRSYSFLERGSVLTASSTYTGSIDQEGDMTLTTNVGAELATFTGIGAGTITATTAVAGSSVGLHHEEHYTGIRTKESSNTLTTRFQTSDDPALIGPPGDVFVGHSTNITYGLSRNITIVPSTEKKADDIVYTSFGDQTGYSVIERDGIAFGETFGTLFAFPQQHLEKVLIPNLIKIRNSILLPSSITESAAENLAASTRKAVYVSKLASDDPNFGASNHDKKAFGTLANADPFDDGRSYKIYFPAGTVYFTDTIMTLNQYIGNWQARLSDNEKKKLEAGLMENYSFHAGSPISYSSQFNSVTHKENSFNIILSGSLWATTIAKVAGNGIDFSIQESLGTSQGGSFGYNSVASSTRGFTLASNGTDDYFTVDVSIDADSNFVFRTKGGASACPYEGATYTQYYQKNTVLDQPTQQMEVPKLAVDKPVVTSIPSSRKASYNLFLRNESQTKSPATFILGYVDNDRVKGATIAIDGTPIGGSGRAVVVQYGETITKELTLAKGANAMDYENIMILLHSSCQYDPTSYQTPIADTVLISAHFIPSCSDIRIKAPADQWILNNSSPPNSQNNRYLPVTIDQFDVNNKLFDHIELQYKPSSSSTWTTAMKFYADSTKMKAAEGSKQFITNAKAILYNLEMNDASFSDQHFDIQAVGYCALGAGSYVTTESNKVSGIKDTYNPRLFGTPQPANGVLGISDEIRLNFNEPIATGLLTTNNFQVTGIRNGVQSDHSVSVRLDGKGNYLTTEFDKNLTGKKITAEIWVLPNAPANGTLISHGNASTSMELALTADNHLQLLVGQNTITSDAVVAYKPGEWAHVAMVYDYSIPAVSAFYNFKEVIHNAPVAKYEGIGHFEFGRGISKGGNFFAGKMHELRIWTTILDGITLQVNSLKRLSGSEHGLMAYYPMNEGKGKVCFDMAQSSHARLTGNWTTPPGKALDLNADSYVKMNTSNAIITTGMDYSLELWFKGQPGQTNAALVSNGKGDGKEGGVTRNLFFLGFENGLLTYQNNAYTIQADGNFLDNNWHHVAITVNRNAGTAQLYVDGLLNKYFDPKSLGGLAAAYTYLGVRAWYDTDPLSVQHLDRYFKGNIDEFRIWNTYLNQTIVSNNNNVRLSGNEVGLLAYYPFEKYTLFQNQQVMDATLLDQKIQKDIVRAELSTLAKLSDETAPIKDRGPVDNLRFDFVANNDGLIINMLEPKQSIDKTIITLTALDIPDVNGNKIESPITWTAYIDRNQLKWGDDRLDLSKDVYAPMQFESYLVNNGGNIQHFRLDNMPLWLTASPSSGTIDPKSKVKIVFTVNEGLNTGTYDEIVYMRNDNNEAEALPVSMTVKGKQPDWKVSAADYKYSMSVYGKIRINGVFSFNKGDRLAAFARGKCVGVTNNTHYPGNDLWYAFLTVYGDAIQSDKIEFRIWEANTGKTYLATPATPITFRNDAVIGTSGNPVIFDGKETIYQDISLNQKWNWVSFNVALSPSDSVIAVLANGNWKSGDIVKNEELGFNQYSSAAGWLGYMYRFNNTSLFMLNTATAQTLSISGTAVDVKKTPIPLKGSRWNYISYLPQVNMTVKDALAGYIASDEDVIKSQSGFAMYNPQNGWVGNLTYLEPGKGYMLYRKAASDTSFVYPGLNGTLTNHPFSATTPIQTLNAMETPVQSNYNFVSNMTVTAVAGDGFVWRTGDTVLAYVAGEVRGKARPAQNLVTGHETLFFTIAGEQEQPVYLQVKRNGVLIAQSDTVIMYQPNKKLGTVSQPLVLHFKDKSGSAVPGFVSAYPNPFSRLVNINITLPDATAPGIHNMQLSIYDVNGKLILKRSAERFSNSQYHTTWNGKTSAGQECMPGIYFIKVDADGQTQVYKIIKD